uniref:(northern house mosquito) hypothetical protein n=1 Tax=Culex pipiens TaxID=7175 RepID=A0A8D7ZSW3_CULPI
MSWPATRKWVASSWLRRPSPRTPSCSPSPRWSSGPSGTWTSTSSDRRSFRAWAASPTVSWACTGAIGATGPFASPIVRVWSTRICTRSSARFCALEGVRSLAMIRKLFLTIIGTMRCWC